MMKTCLSCSNSLQTTPVAPSCRTFPILIIFLTVKMDRAVGRAFVTTVTLLVTTPITIATIEVTVTNSSVLPKSESDRVGNNGTRILSEPLFKLYKKHLERVAFAPNVTAAADDEEVERWMRNLIAWTPPDYILTNFPHHFPGCSYDGHPVWIIEGGKFDVNALFRQGPDMIEAAEKALERAILQSIISINGALPPDGELRIGEEILDLEGMNVNKFSDPQAIVWAAKIAQRYYDVRFLLIRRSTVINSNYFVQTMLGLFRPILGQLMERMDIYGPDRRKWLPQVLRILPYSSLPPCCGGDPNKEYKPVRWDPANGLCGL